MLDCLKMGFEARPGTRLYMPNIFSRMQEKKKKKTSGLEFRVRRDVKHETSATSHFLSQPRATPRIETCGPKTEILSG